MKKIIALLLSFIMVFTLTSTAFAAEGGYTFTILADDTTVTVGDTITVTLEISKDDGDDYTIYGMQDYVCFDPEYFTYVEDSITVLTDDSSGYAVSVFNSSALDFDSDEINRVFLNRFSTYAMSGESTEILSFELKTIKTGTTQITHDKPEMMEADTSALSVTTVNATITISASESSGGDSGDSSGSSSGSSSGGSSGGTTTTTPEYDVTIDAPTSSDTTATLEAGGSVSDGVLTADLDTDHIEYAIEMALDDADSSDEITVIVNITSDEDFGDFSLNLPLEAQELILDNNISFFILATDNVQVNIDYQAIQTIDSSANDDVQVTVTRTDTDADIVGNRPAYSFDISNDDVTVSDFGTGTITIGIPYTLAAGETADTILMVYVAEDGSVTKVAGSYYDEGAEMAMATVSHFSIYAVGYDADWNGGFLFDDVKDASTYYFTPVYWATQNGITTGTTDTTFSPTATCTRAQAVTFLWRAAGEPVVNYINPFTDVDADSYYYEAVLWAVSEGVTTGTSDTTFSPDMDCSRSQIVTLLYREAGEPAVGGECDFTDVSAGSFYYDAVLWAVENGVTAGTSDTMFSPNSDCTRAEIVTFLYRYLAK